MQESAFKPLHETPRQLRSGTSQLPFLFGEISKAPLQRLKYLYGRGAFSGVENAYLHKNLPA